MNIPPHTSQSTFDPGQDIAVPRPPQPRGAAVLSRWRPPRRTTLSPAARPTWPRGLPAAHAAARPGPAAPGPGQSAPAPAGHPARRARCPAGRGPSHRRQPGPGARHPRGNRGASGREGRADRRLARSQRRLDRAARRIDRQRARQARLLVRAGHRQHDLVRHPDGGQETVTDLRRYQAAQRAQIEDETARGSRKHQRLPRWIRHFPKLVLALDFGLLLYFFAGITDVNWASPLSADLAFAVLPPR